MSQDSKMQIAVVAEDIQVGAKVAKIFKILGLVPHTFDDAKEFLNSSTRTQYNLCFLDIKKSKVAQKIVIKNPSLSNCRFAFMHDEQSHNLLGPTFTESHLGYVNTEYELLGQVKYILNRYNNELRELEEISQYKNYFLHHSPKSKDMMKTLETYREKLHYHDLIEEFVQKFDNALLTRNFSDALSSALHDFEPVLNFAVFKINESGTKLINLELTGEKTLDIPSLWLGKSDDIGIGEHTITVVENILSPLVKQTLLNMSLSRNNETSDILLSLEIDDQYAYQINWTMIEGVLSGKYAQYINRLNSITEDKRERGLFSLLDQIQEGGEASHLVAVDITDITDVLMTNADINFEWEKFYSDFSTYAQNFLKAQGLYIADPEHLLVTIKSDEFSSDYDALRDYCQKLELSKYFVGVNRSQLFGLEARVKEVPFSIYALTNYLKNESNAKAQIHSQQFNTSRNITL